MSLVRAFFLCAFFLPWSAHAAEQSFCCNDASGRRVCGNPLPPVCYDRGYRELSRGGNLVREVEPPLTPEQRAKRDAEIKAKKDRLAAEAAANRRDQVLLDSYPTLADLDKRRDQELGIVGEELRVNHVRESQILAARAELDKKKAALGNKKIPAKLEAELESNDLELSSVRMILTSKQKEYDALKARFDYDRKRYTELIGSPPPPTPTTQPAKR